MTPALDDDALLLAIAANNRTALQRLYERHSTALYSLAIRILDDRVEAEELLYATFLHVWESAKTIELNQAKPSTWLLMLVRSRALDKLRLRQVEGLTSATNDSLEKTTQIRLSDQHVSSPEHASVRRVLDALPGELREPIEHAYFSARTREQIADVIGVPQEMIDALIRTGMQQIKSMLNRPAQTASSG